MATFYTVKQTAKILGFSTNSIYKFLDQGRLRGHRGLSDLGRFKIPHTAIEKFVGTPIPEDAVKAALQAAPEPNMQIKKEFVAGASPAPYPPVNPPVYGLPLKITRLLIIVGLICLLLDLVLSQDFSFTDQALRLVLMGILIVLTYQYGGLSVSQTPA
ncbi:hypothetical protein A2W24_06575 [Microgenomates group bacterium RBG_16_45_19]|nr:MAG: hypothetical protein A2W24_06575 [Microgenomates group bacterium RBG_16_45_19]